VLLQFRVETSMHDEIFPGTSAMARRMRQLDWSKTPLGPPERWPQSLRTSVSTCLDCAFPIVVWWGPELAILYNDEYGQILGPAKHPSALGRPGSQVWSEIWDVIDPMLSQVMQHAEPTRSRDLLLHVDRGYLEEAYFSFSYSPIRAEDGKVGGVFCPVIETTDKVIGERRLRTLRDLSDCSKGAESAHAVCVAAASVLAVNALDVPFALVYRIDDRQRSAELLATAGISPGTAASPARVALDVDGDGTWSLAAVARSGRPVLASDLHRQFPSLPSGAWKTPPHSAMVLPVLMPGSDHPRAVLVAAVSPMRALDDDYRTFFELVASQIASGVADAEALEAERARAAALAELDRAKTAFFSNVSHEFRTPLTLMIGPLNDLLASASATGVVGADAVTSIEIAHRNSLRLLKLVNTLLDFSRIEAGRIDASYEATDLSSLTSGLASVFRAAIEKAGLQLVVDCEPLPEPVFVDRDMWEKIVLNLLSNAFKFTFDGEIRVRLQWLGEHVELSISDTGTGIPESDVAHVFERFHRVKHARARTHEGTGIGLALVHELTRLHGGSVSVRSREGHGTTFVVRIPTGTAHLSPERIAAPRRLVSTGIGATPYVEEAWRWLPGVGAAPNETPRVPEIPGVIGTAPTQAGTARVLVADDNADMRDYLTRMLGTRYHVETVGDGRAALESITAQPPDVVLTDVMMPGLDGFGLLAAIRADDRTRALPVIVLSARAGEEARIEGLNAGADDYLVKPFSARELLARVSSQLELARLRRETEQVLRYRSEEHQTLVHQAPLGIYVVDADFTIREINPVALPVFGDIPGGIVGRDFSDVIHVLWSKEYADEIVSSFRRTLETGEPYVMPERAEFRIDRQVVEYYEWRLTRITLPDGRYGVVCYFRDISAQVKARLAIADSERRLRDADRRKDEFLALLAHELRNPLAPIRTGLELIRLSGDRPATVRRVRSMMERQVGHMVRLIDDLLDVSRITSGKIVLRRVQTPLTELVQSAVDAQRAAIREAGIDLTIDLPDAPCIVDVDPTRFVQVVSNVLHNAMKFTPSPGTIRVSADIVPASTGENSELVLSIADSGVGISTEMLPRVFELFTQGDPPTTPHHGGLGIGLALARRLIEMHDGRIEASSDGPGGGSTFAIRLPVCHGAVEAPTKPRDQVRRISSRVLVVDDNQDAAKTMAMLVEALGGRAATANDALTALAMIGEFQPDVVFLDIGMPGIDGYEACRRIRLEPAARRPVIVALTGWGHPQDKQRALEAGFDAHLTKPVAPSAVEDLLAVSAGARQTSVSA
jgi:PAS domain S-box-containing protein